MRKYTDKQIKRYCARRVSIAKKYKYVNFWTFIQLDLIDKRWKRN